jgi:glycyl-tRNA synthetase (class II)
MPATELDQIVNLCKRRGFVYPSAEIYGGFRSSYDYGPLGSLMLRNVKDAWVRTMVQKRDDTVLIDASILSPPQVWEASGHLVELHRPARRLHQLQAAVPRGPSGGPRDRARTARRRGRSPRLARST